VRSRCITTATSASARRCVVVALGRIVGPNIIPKSQPGVSGTIGRCCTRPDRACRPAEARMEPTEAGQARLSAVALRPSSQASSVLSSVLWK
jgi:hypothetical protein